MTYFYAVGLACLLGFAAPSSFGEDKKESPAQARPVKAETPGEFVAEEGQTWKDFKTSFSNIFIAGYKQFTLKSSWAIAAAGAPALWYAFEEDKTIARRNRGKEKASWFDAADSASVFTTFPVLHAGFYAAGRMIKDRKMQQFAMEFFSAAYLTLAETALLSFVYIHKRPNTDNLSKWETNFRGDSSFPSGHMAPLAALTFKTFQFYGPAWALAPLAGMYFSAYQRVRENKHYLSDVVGSFILAGMASEGVRHVANSGNNHSWYNRLFGQNTHVSVLAFRDIKAVSFSWDI